MKFTLTIFLFFLCSPLALATQQPFNFCEWALNRGNTELYQDIARKLGSGRHLSQDDLISLGDTIAKAVQALHFTTTAIDDSQDGPPNAVWLLNERFENLTNLLRKRIAATTAYDLNFASALEDIDDDLRDSEGSGLKPNLKLKFELLWGEYLARPFNLSLLLENHHQFISAVGDSMEGYLLTGDPEFAEIGSRLLNRLLAIWNVSPDRLKARERPEFTKLKQDFKYYLSSMRLPSSREFYVVLASDRQDTRTLEVCDSLYASLRSIYQTLTGLAHLKQEFPKSWKRHVRFSAEEKLMLEFAKIVMPEIYRVDEIHRDVRDLFSISDATVKALMKWNDRANQQEQILFPTGKNEFASAYQPAQFVTAIKYVIGISRLNAVVTIDDPQPLHSAGWLTKIARSFTKEQFDELVSSGSSAK